jgi:transitional endoplasmic reticulum ATPase
MTQAAAPGSATATRPAPGRPVPDDGVELADCVLADLGVGIGDLVRVTGYTGRVVFSRVAAGSDDPSALVRLGRMLWTQLGVRPGDTVQVSREPHAADAGAVVLRPAFHLSHHLGDRVIDTLRERAALVWPAATIFVPIFSGGGGVVVRVEQVDPPTGEHGHAHPHEHAHGHPHTHDHGHEHQHEAPAHEHPAAMADHTTVEFADPDPDIASRRATFAEVGGLDSALSRLRDLIELPLLRPGLYRTLGVRAPRGVILHGPPGTGKTLLSRAVGQELRANVMTMSATELVGTYSGETEANLRSLFSEASHHAPSLIVIDEIDVIATGRSRLASQGDIRATTQLLSLLDGLDQVDGVVVLATTNRIDVVDEAFRRPGRFDEEIYVGPPDAAARRAILAVHSREMPLTPEAEFALDEIASSRTAGFTGADLMHLARETGLFAARRLTGGGAGRGIEVAEAAGSAELAILAEDVYAAADAVRPSATRGLPVPVGGLPWDGFDGVEAVQAALLEAADSAFAPDATHREGVLLTGPSGTGKSALVAALARQVGANLVMVDGSTIFTQWLGESEAAIRTLFGKARDVAPAIVTLENLDAVAPVRTPGAFESAGGRVLSALLSSVDESIARPGVLVVGVTDRPELIDPALLRAGRLGHHVELELPDLERRRAIIARMAASVLAPDEITGLAERTAGASAAEVDRRARHRAGRRPSCDTAAERSAQRPHT